MTAESILVIENKLVIKAAMTQWLTTSDYPVESVASGQEALKKLR